MDANDQEILENQDSWENEEIDDADEAADERRPFAGDEADEAPSATDAEIAAEAAVSGAEWFVVHSYSGYENKVKKNLEQRIETMGMQNKIFRVVVPTEEEVEIRDGQRRTSRRRVFPGYILVQMVMDDESWYVVRNTPGVTGFVGSGTRPTPLSEEEVDKILRRMETEQPRIKVSFRVGETVRITEGPFADFMAVVDELYPDRGKVRVLVSFFGRETPVEMDFLQVERI
jgi:transcriptional antiterminator NusG